MGKLVGDIEYALGVVEDGLYEDDWGEMRIEVSGTSTEKLLWALDEARELAAALEERADSLEERRRRQAQRQEIWRG